jgi:hypothetical protein
MPVDAASAVVDFDIIPSICTLEAAQRLSEVITRRHIETPFKVGRPHHISHIHLVFTRTPVHAFQHARAHAGQVHLKIDTGMSRVGVQVSDVDRFVEFIESRKMVVEGMFTHFADAWTRPSFTELQLEKFELATAPYKGSKLRHVSGSAGIIRKYGVGYDLIRPGVSMYLCVLTCFLGSSWLCLVSLIITLTEHWKGISLYGIPPDTDIDEFRSYGFEPSLSWIAYPTLVKVRWTIVATSKDVVSSSHWVNVSEFIKGLIAATQTKGPIFSLKVQRHVSFFIVLRVYFMTMWHLSSCPESYLLHCGQSRATLTYLVQPLACGASVGYSLTYQVKEPVEYIATIPLGYAGACCDLMLLS